MVDLLTQVIMRLVYRVDVGSVVYVCLNHERAKVGLKWGSKDGQL